MAEIIVRPVATLAEMAQITQLQKTIWQSADMEVVPVHTLHAIQFNGGMLYGAYAGDEVVGFVLGILGTIPGLERVDKVAAARLKLYSVVAGVLPAYQDRGVGYRLKLAQRDFAINIGVRLVTWTYDPLESRNGRFNIGKLGGVCHRYLRDFHGELGGLNAGLPTDRFEVEWWVTSNRVEGRVVKERGPLSMEALLGGGAHLINPAHFNKDDFPVPPTEVPGSDSSLIMVEIPADFQIIKQQDMALATLWRMHTRQLFESLFNHHYLVTDFVVDRDDAGRSRSFYLLTHQNS